MSQYQRELDRNEKKRALLQKQYDAVEQSWLAEINPATHVSLDYQLEVLEAELSELDESIADLRQKIKIEKEIQEREEAERWKEKEEEEKRKRPPVRHTFELTLIKNGSSCKILARDPQRQNIQADIVLPLLPHSSQSADIKLLDSIGQGRLLYNTFFPHPISSRFMEAIDTAKKEDASLLLLIKTHSADEYIDLPWEWIHNGNGFFVLQYPCSILRLVINPTQTISVIAPKALPCILFTNAIPQGYDDFDLPEEAIFQSAGYQSVPEKRITAPRFLHRLTNGSETAQPFNIWHHHGYASASGLLFCDVQRRPTQFPITEIAATLRMGHRIWMTVLVLETSQDSLLASALMSLDVPLILVFPAKMRPLVLQTFLDTFYQHLGSLPPEDAMHKAQIRASQLCIDDIQWAMPILISHVTLTWGKYDR